MIMKFFKGYSVRIMSIVAIIAMAGLVLGAGEAFAAAAKYPDKNKTIIIIVKDAAGGSTDTQTRILAEALKPLLGCNVEVVNKPGAGGQIGMQAIATAKPDGYTLGSFNNPTVMGIYLMPQRKATFSLKSFTPIGLHVFDPETITVRADSPYKTYQELIAAAKAKPKTIKASTNGMFSDDHMAIVTVENKTGAKFAAVHFDGSAEEGVALLGGKIDCSFMGVGYTNTFVKAGTMRRLTIMDDAPLASDPTVPTLKSLGVDFVIGSSRGLCGPAGLSKEVVAVLQAAHAKAVKDPAVIEKFNNMGTPIRYLNAADYAKSLAVMEKSISPSIDLMMKDQGIEIPKGGAVK
jgi:tripartite-type tricarboxylate transporter receptor subunit TctC